MSVFAPIIERLKLMLEGEDEPVAIMATVACELHHGVDFLSWTGFYRTTAPELLTVGPYQGGHGCLRIPFRRGVCGAAARKQQTQLVDDVDKFPGHIACSSSTRSELVVPILHDGKTIAVLDLDSDHPAAFSEADARCLEAFCAWLAPRVA